jgi:Photosynthesis affected mutant 68
VSSSWDEEREGSFLGVEEFQKNVGSIKEGLDRSKENLVLREKMAGLPEAEIEAAIVDLERRDKRRQSLATKIEQEMEK